MPTTTQSAKLSTAQEKKLCQAIIDVLPEMIQEWNTVKLAQFETLFEKSFAEYFENRQTQEKTKIIAPILDSIFVRLMQRRIPNWTIAEGKGKDYLYGTIPFESKITLGAGNGWTGNGYMKTPWHLLMRFECDADGHIVNKFAMIVDLSQCESQWTAPGTSSNFSTLSFLSKDLALLKPIVGTVSAKTPKGKPAVRITPIMESV